MNELASQPKNKRSLRRISLRAFMLFATVVMVLGGYFLPRIQRQRMAVRAIEKNGGSVFYDYQFVDGHSDSGAVSPVPNWILSRLGPDVFHRVVAVYVNVRRKKYAVLNTEFNTDSWSALAELTSAKYFRMDYGECEVESFRHIQKLKKLETLQIREVALGDEAIAYLGGLHELRSITMSSCGLGDASLSVFARLPKLRTLKLYDGAFSNEGLATSSAAPQLTELFLDGERCTIDDDGLPQLAKLKRLKILGLQHTQITDVGLQHFDPMKSIKELHVGYTNVTWSGADQFKKSKRPDVIFQGGGLSR